MTVFEHITILVRPGSEFNDLELCRGCDEHYTIYSDGLVAYAICCGSESLDSRREYDREHLRRVVEILHRAIRLVEDRYDL